MNLKISKRKAYWILQVGGWSIYLIANAGFMFAGPGFKLHLFINQFILTIYLLGTTHMFRNIAVNNRWLSLSLMRLLPRTLAVFLIFSVGIYLFQIIIGYFLNTIDYVEDFDILFITAFIFLHMIYYLLWVSVYFIYHYFEKYNASLKYDAAMYEIELNKLKSQLNPHFIFNALNSIRALVDEDPVKSKSAITQLSNILRNSLIMNKRKLIDFGDELKTVTDYLELEHIRLEERLKIELDISPGVESFQVPPLMIQTLVENGIKHGVATLPKGGKLSIKAWVEDNGLKIQIRNSGQYVNGVKLNSTGYGLENTTQRLNLIFGKAASFSISNENEKTVLTEIKLPQYI